MNREISLENITLFDCYLYASEGYRATVENGMVTEFSKDEE